MPYLSNEQQVIDNKYKNRIFDHCPLMTIPDVMVRLHDGKFKQVIGGHY